MKTRHIIAIGLLTATAVGLLAIGIKSAYKPPVTSANATYEITDIAKFQYRETTKYDYSLEGQNNNNNIRDNNNVELEIFIDYTITIENGTQIINHIVRPLTQINVTASLVEFSLDGYTVEPPEEQGVYQTSHTFNFNNYATLCDFQIYLLNVDVNCESPTATYFLATPNFIIKTKNPQGSDTISSAQPTGWHIVLFTNNSGTRWQKETVNAGIDYFETTFETINTALGTEYTNGYTSGLNADTTEAYNEGYNEGQTNGYNTGYHEGYSTGYATGDADGYEAGYNEGYDDGEIEGYNDGYGNGVAFGYDATSFNNPLDITGLMLNILTMPFTFINQAFDVTLWPGTQYAFNFARFIKGLLAIMAILFIIRLFTSGFSIIGNYTQTRNDSKLTKQKIKESKARTNLIKRTDPNHKYIHKD